MFQKFFKISNYKSTTVELKESLHVNKSIRSQMFFKTGILKNFAILTGKHLGCNIFLWILRKLLRTSFFRCFCIKFRCNIKSTKHLVFIIINLQKLITCYSKSNIVKLEIIWPLSRLHCQYLLPLILTSIPTTKARKFYSQTTLKPKLKLTNNGCRSVLLTSFWYH